MKHLSTLFLVLVLTGCGTTAAQWANAFPSLNQEYTPYDYQNDHYQSFKNLPTDWDHVPGSYSTQNNGTMRYMINTPQGIQYRTCQNLDGNYQYCH